MEIISHRGYWIKPEERNTINSFIYSIKSSFGTETDVRDFCSELVISHDIANYECLKLDVLIEIFKKADLLLAINIKADGLQKLLQKSLMKYNFNKYFVFDMSIPDTIQYINMGFNVFCRQSEYEIDIPFYKEIDGIWLDSFEKIWYNEDLLANHLSHGKKVCIVSSELHQRDHLSHWEILKTWSILENKDLILCTDYPKEALKYFKNA